MHHKTNMRCSPTLCLLIFCCLSANMSRVSAQNKAKNSRIPTKTAKVDDKNTPSVGDTMYVIRQMGLDLYEKPAKDAKILTHLACGTALTYFKIADPKTLQNHTNIKKNLPKNTAETSVRIEDLNGFWFKIQHKNTVGYGFSAFLSPEKPDSLATSSTLLLPNIVNKISYKNANDFNWYGIYKKDNLRLQTKKIEHLDFYTQSPEHSAKDSFSVHLQVKTKQPMTDSIMFLIGLRKKGNTDIASGMLPESLYIGGVNDAKKDGVTDVLNGNIVGRETIAIGHTDWRLKLEKTFVRIEPATERDKPTAKLTDWKLLLIHKNGQQKQVILNKTNDDMPKFSIAAYGDFDEDGRLDFILCNGENDYTLFLSSPSQTTLVKLIKKG